MGLALLAAVWAIHNRGHSYPKASGALPTARLTLPQPEPGLATPLVTTDGTRFVKAGQPIVLQGYDLSVTGPSVYSRAAELNANFVRITVPWSEIEPTRPSGMPGHLTHHWNTDGVGRARPGGHRSGRPGNPGADRLPPVPLVAVLRQSRVQDGSRKLQGDRGAGLVLHRPLPRRPAAESRPPRPISGTASERRPCTTTPRSPR